MIAIALVIALSPTKVPALQQLGAYRPLPFLRHSKKATSLNMQVWSDCRSCNDAASLEANFDHGTLRERPDVFLVPKREFRIDGDSPHTDGVQYLTVDAGEASSLVMDPDSGQTIGAVVNIKDAKGQDSAIAALGSVEWLVVECYNKNDQSKDEKKSRGNAWQMIPAENLIAAAQGSGTKLAFCVDKPSSVGGLARALELGVDALCVDASVAPHALWEAAFAARKERELDRKDSNEKEADSPHIIKGRCWRRSTANTIVVDRVCVDLVQNLLPEEGCWIGSSAKTTALVLSEAASSQYVPTRPFRVNAGPVHSYILMHDATTKYLSELKPGDQVEVYNCVSRTARPVAVGRLKQELRPSVLIELESDEKGISRRGQVFLQQAETVRLASDASNGEFIRVTDLEAHTVRDDQCTCPVLLRITTKGTHVGKAYGGSVKEK